MVYAMYVGMKITINIKEKKMKYYIYDSNFELVGCADREISETMMLIHMNLGNIISTSELF
jgi:hypothetical protein